MEPVALTRRDVARQLGLTYSTLRVYERHLGELLELSSGPNRTVLYGPRALELVREAIALKRRGLPFTKLTEYFRGDLRPDPAPRTLDLSRIQRDTERILDMGRRIEERLSRMERQYRQLEGRLAPTEEVCHA